MESRVYWKIFAKCHRDGRRANRGEDYHGTSEIFHEGQLLPLETYLEIPTFRRRGRKLAV